jgi:hypothetical protein
MAAEGDRSDIRVVREIWGLVCRTSGSACEAPDRDRRIACRSSSLRSGNGVGTERGTPDMFVVACVVDNRDKTIRNPDSRRKWSGREASRSNQHIAGAAGHAACRGHGRRSPSLEARFFPMSASLGVSERTAPRLVPHGCVRSRLSQWHVPAQPGEGRLKQGVVHTPCSSRPS